MILRIGLHGAANPKWNITKDCHYGIAHSCFTFEAPLLQSPHAVVLRLCGCNVRQVDILTPEATDYLNCLICYPGQSQEYPVPFTEDSLPKGHIFCSHDWEFKLEQMNYKWVLRVRSTPNPVGCTPMHFFSVRDSQWVCVLRIVVATGSFKCTL